MIAPNYRLIPRSPLPAQIKHTGQHLRYVQGVPRPSAPEVARLITEFFERTLGT